MSCHLQGVFSWENPIQLHKILHLEVRGKLELKTRRGKGGLLSGEGRRRGGREGGEGAIGSGRGGYWVRQIRI